MYVCIYIRMYVLMHYVCDITSVYMGMNIRLNACMYSIIIACMYVNERMYVCMYVLNNRKY